MEDRHIVSTMRSSGRAAIMHEKRKVKLFEGEAEFPGPAVYTQPS